MVQVGDRVTVRGLIGRVKYIGEPKFAPGTWCGVELDKPSGKNDGSVEGIRYFNTNKTGLYGIFSKYEGVKKISDEEEPEELGLNLSSSKSSSCDDIRLKRIIDKLQEKLYKLHNECKSLQLQLASKNSLEDRITELEHSVELATIENETLEEHNELLGHDLLSLKKRHEAVVEELEGFKEELILRRVIEDEELKKDDVDPVTLWKRSKLVEHALVKLQSSLEASRKVNKSLEGEKHEVEAENKKLKSEIFELTNQLDDAKKIITDLTSQLDAEGSYNNIVDMLTEKNIQLTEEIEELKQALETTKDKQTFDEKLERMYKEVEEELSNEVEDLQRAMESHKYALKTLQSENAKLKNLLSHAETIEKDNNSESQAQSLSIEISRLKFQNYQNTFEKEMMEKSLMYRGSVTLKELSAQLEYLGKRVIDDSINEPKGKKCLSQVTLMLLRAVTDILEELQKQNAVHDSLISEFFNQADLESWSKVIKEQRLLKCVDFSKVVSFIHSNEDLDNNATIALKFASRISDPICHILALYKELYPEEINAIQKLYATVIDLEKETLQTSNQLEEKQELSLQVSDESVSNILSNFGNNFLFPILNKTEFNDGSVADELGKLTANLKIFQKSINDFQFFAQPESNACPTNNTSAPVIHNLVLKEGVVQYQDRIKELENLITQKDNHIDELLLKVRVIESKLQKELDHEKIIRTLKEEVNELQKNNASLKSQIQSMNLAIANLNGELKSEQLKRDNLISSKRFNCFYEEREHVSKLDLISEIQDLRGYIERKESIASKTNYNWLHAAVPSKRSYIDIQFQNDLNSIQSLISNYVAFSDILPIQTDASTRKWKPKMNVPQYFVSKLNEEKFAINSMVNEILK